MSGTSLANEKCEGAAVKAVLRRPDAFDRRFQTERTLPHNLDAERAVLGAILLHNEVLAVAQATIDANDFFRDAHRRIFDTMVKLVERGDAIDLITLRDELGESGVDKVGGPAYITALTDGVPRSTNVEHYAHIVKEKARLRNLILSANKTLSMAYAGDEDAADIASAARAEMALVDVEECGADGDPWARRLPDLLATLDAPDAPALIAGFVPSGVITLLHGQPRDWKTLVALHVALAVATARALFGLARLSVPLARNVLYVTEEDSARRVTERLQLICAGLGCDLPANLFVAAGTGFSLDDQESQTRLTAFVRAHDIALVIPDPLRSMSACVDQGPRELRPLTLMLRSLMRETGCTVFAIHHDSKPLAVGIDARRRPQRASGGAVFSIADAPIGIDALPDGRRLVTPTAWKFSEDPPSILLALESGVGSLRLVGTDADGVSTAADVDLTARVLAVLTAHPRTSGRAITTAVRGRKVAVAACLERLARVNKIDCVKVGRSRCWFVCDENAGNHSGNQTNAPVLTAPDVGAMARQQAEMLSASMVPAVGNHAEPYDITTPPTGGDPVNGSLPYKGNHHGNHATGNREDSDVF